MGARVKLHGVEGVDAWAIIIGIGFWGDGGPE